MIYSNNLEAKALTPICAAEENGVCEITPWNRKYTLSDSPFLSSLISDGKELLAAPMRLVGLENGNELVISDVSSGLMYGCDDGKEVKACQYMQSSRFIFNTSVSAEYDGMMDWSLTVASHGPSVAQVFGLNDKDNRSRILDRLWLEIPLRSDATISYHFAPNKPVLIDGVVPDIPSELYAAGAMPKKSMALPFLQQLFVGNDKVGFAVFFESDKNWQVEDPRRAIECIVNGEETVIRLHLLDSAPRIWTAKSGDALLHLPPISFRIGMQVTPVKPFPSDPYKERNLHIDCFKKIPESYEDFLFSPFEDTAEKTIDRISRLGVNTLYIHEKWNDIQNSPFLTRKSAERLKLIVNQAHARGIKVIPYFGYELSTLSPIYAEKSEEYLNGCVDWHWYRLPWQRARTVCYNSGWQDVFVEGVEHLMDEFGFDGLYLDSIKTCDPCDNEAHGCGYRDEDGKLHPTYPAFAIRKLMKRLCAMVEKRGGIICSHSYGTFPVASMAFSHVLWEGESVQSYFMKGALNEVPESYYRAVYTGRNLGVPINMLCYSNPPTWTFTEAMSNVLCFGILPKPNDTGAPLEIMSKIWGILDSFPLENSTWHPYFDNGVSVSDENVKFSFYKAPNKLLCFTSNMKKTALNVNVTLPFKAKRVTDAFTLECLAESENSFNISIGGFGARILIIDLCE